MPSATARAGRYVRQLTGAAGEVCMVKMLASGTWASAWRRYFRRSGTVSITMKVAIIQSAFIGDSPSMHVVSQPAS
jgi:hypothetical protein